MDNDFNSNVYFDFHDGKDESSPSIFITPSGCPILEEELDIYIEEFESQERDDFEYYEDEEETAF